MLQDKEQQHVLLTVLKAEGIKQGIVEEDWRIEHPDRGFFHIVLDDVLLLVKPENLSALAELFSAEEARRGNDGFWYEKLLALQILSYQARPEEVAKETAVWKHFVLAPEECKTTIKQYLKEEELRGLMTPLKQFMEYVIEDGIAQYEPDLGADNPEEHFVFDVNDNTFPIAIAKDDLGVFLLQAGVYGSEVKSVFLDLRLSDRAELKEKRVCWRPRRIGENPFALRDYVDEIIEGRD